MGSSSCFAEILGSLVDLTDSEHQALHRLEERQRVLRRGATLQRENESADELFVLRKGVIQRRRRPGILAGPKR